MSEETIASRTRTPESGRTGRCTANHRRSIGPRLGSAPRAGIPERYCRELACVCTEVHCQSQAAHTPRGPDMDQRRCEPAHTHPGTPRSTFLAGSTSLGSTERWQTSVRQESPYIRSFASIERQCVCYSDPSGRHQIRRLARPHRCPRKQPRRAQAMPLHTLTYGADTRSSRFA